MITTIMSFVTSLLGNKYVLIGLFVVSSLLYVNHLRTSNATLRNEKIKLEQTIVEQQEAVAALKRDIKQIVESNNIVAEEKTKLENEKKALDETLYREKQKKKSLEELALKKTTLIEKLVNAATKKVFNCFEVISQGGDC